ncbi:hypothetical protein RO3G_15654 [Rhizopus delemar RA 99-880]|uniref:RING-type domain-containing protein n=1 Tax=Rhizopus delemar (strain RA 99-880 / ATCC MYA-4621 / FGSC 9543 / NRRL 43880) TaxID=246409 RepID=I1CR63_RHIO9|nr:hypothetical protein RO3G_15654 [Rhizopus delemar RA 99-880]|eukprot:EIE90943.1 hypothetical protein RO3G_15654 [Rhizopus delemar RA 99-880]
MVTDDLSDSEALQEAIRQSLSESRGFHEESYLDSDSDSSQIMDLTAEGFSLVTNDNNTNRPLANQKSDLPIEDDIYAFFVEAGLENPEELQMLGIDIETIRAQKALEERIERESKRDYELARRLQSEFENEIQQASSSSQSTSWQPSDSPRDPPVSLKREIDRGAEDKKKKARLEPMNSIEIEDDSDEEEIAALIRMTQEESVKDYLSHVPWNTYDPEAASSAAAQKRKYKTAIRRHGTGSGGNFDVDMDPNRPRMYVPPFPLSPYYPTEDSGGSSSSSSLSGYGHEGNRNLPLALRQQDHMSTIVNQVRQESFDSAFRNHQISNEEVEKELRTLLENITDDEPPPPEDRTAMAIICQNPCENPTAVDLSTIPASRRNVEGELQLKATLIVCPVSLIDQWRREIESKTEPKLNVHVYHGSNRVSNPYRLAPFDVIISSYAVAASDFNETSKGPLSKVKLHRVILDEAHTIKNKATIAAQGCCQIESTYRWCMTATPIQNKVDELYSLIKFLRIRPFCEWEEFRDAISKPMRSSNPEKGIKAAHVLMKAISLRRSKKAMIDGRPILNLPERNVHMTHIDFSPDERIHYDFVNARAQAQFTKYLKAGTIMKNYSSVLVMLLRLRQACLHPSLTTEEDGDAASDADQPDSLAAARQMNPEVVRRLLNEGATIKEIECPICMDVAQNAQIMHCGHLLCKECFDSYWNTADGNAKRCPQCRAQINRQQLADVESFLKVHAPDLMEEVEAEAETEARNRQRVAEMLSSAKIDKMLEILDETAHETDRQDKTIVFSQFTSMLSMLEKPLKNRGHKYLRYDGSMDVRQRAETVNKFFDDPQITVLLVSTKCGSLGLNLTCANRVILLDVWWNPAIENQAIDRVHRIGQTKAVDVHRIFINDTIEDRILMLQKKKQSIADGVLGEGSTNQVGRLSLNELIYLFRGGNLPTN